jgi:predicted SAM-dependent methyltransferase
MTLKEKLIKENKTRWLDIGCGKNFEEGFYYLDIKPKRKVPWKYRKRYFQMNILKVLDRELKTMGTFDLIRMQHVIEHFSYKEAKIVIKNVAKLLKKEGYFLITTPNLRINIQMYLKKNYKFIKNFKNWAEKKIPKNAPASFYFAIFAYNLPKDPHKWCYDYEGLKYLLESSGYFKEIRELKFSDPLASFPFTHNRPETDLCIICKRI